MRYRARKGLPRAVRSSVSADVESGGDIVVASGSVWTTAYDAALLRLPAG